jgi:hypothetical protein
MSISAVSAPSQIQPQQVSAAVLKSANGDGDGRSGVAALNDGDAAAQKAAQSVPTSGHTVDVKA